MFAAIRYIRGGDNAVACLYNNVFSMQNDTNHDQKKLFTTTGFLCFKQQRDTKTLHAI